MPSSSENPHELDINKNGAPPFVESSELRKFLIHWYTDVGLSADEVGWFWQKSGSAILSMLEKLNIPKRNSGGRRKVVGLAKPSKGRRHLD